MALKVTWSVSGYDCIANLQNILGMLRCEWVASKQLQECKDHHCSEWIFSPKFAELVACHDGWLKQHEKVIKRLKINLNTT